ncbi:hypothetical protein HYV84_04670 [Candidatus Woesearchaeota archaeon]|nr:hypothetical protein [Candidatus Woesearchaeota archaeon]
MRNHHIRYYYPTTLSVTPGAHLSDEEFDAGYVRGLSFLTDTLLLQLGELRFASHNGISALKLVERASAVVGEKTKSEKSGHYLLHPGSVALSGATSTLDDCAQRLWGIENLRNNRGWERGVPSVKIDTEFATDPQGGYFRDPICLDTILAHGGVSTREYQALSRLAGIEQLMRLRYREPPKNPEEKQENRIHYTPATPNFMQAYLAECYGREMSMERIFSLIKCITGTKFTKRAINLACSFLQVSAPARYSAVGKTFEQLRMDYFSVMVPKLTPEIDVEIKALQNQRQAKHRGSKEDIELGKKIQFLTQEKNNLLIRGARQDRLKKRFGSLLDSIYTRHVNNLDTLGEFFDAIGLSANKRYRYPATPDELRDFYFSRVLASHIRLQWDWKKGDMPDKIGVFLGYSSGKIPKGETAESVFRKLSRLIQEKAQVDIFRGLSRDVLIRIGYGGFITWLDKKKPDYNGTRITTVNELYEALGVAIFCESKKAAPRGDGLGFYLETYLGPIREKMREEGIPEFLVPSTEWCREEFRWFHHDIKRARKLLHEGIESWGDFLRYVGESPFLVQRKDKPVEARNDLVLALLEIYFSLKGSRVKTNVLVGEKPADYYLFPLRGELENNPFLAALGRGDRSRSVEYLPGLLKRTGTRSSLLVFPMNGSIPNDKGGFDYLSPEGISQSLSLSHPEASKRIYDLFTKVLGIKTPAWENISPLQEKIAYLRRELVGPSPRFVQMTSGALTPFH